MAPNRVLETRPPISSSSDEESDEESQQALQREQQESEESEEEEADSEESEEEEEEAPVPKPSLNPPSTPLDKKSNPKKPEPIPTSQSHVSSSESESDSDSPPPVDPSVKPLASKPLDDKTKAKKDKYLEIPKGKKTTRSNSRVPTTPTRSITAAKRLIMDDDDVVVKDSKRMKKKVSDLTTTPDDTDEKKSSGGGGDSKKLFQRLWSEDDEIAILKGMISYASKKGVDVSSDMNGFYDFIKKSLHVDVTKTQLGDKIRRLKAKYKNNARKSKQGEDWTFSKPHEHEAFKLSKKIWGGEFDTVRVEETMMGYGKTRKNSKVIESHTLSQQLNNGTAGKIKLLEVPIAPSRCLSESIEFNKTLGVPGLKRDVIMQGLELVEGAKRLELEEEWQKLQVADMELYLRRVDLIKQQTELMLEAIKSSKN